jgi:hypothetical protein
MATCSLLYKFFPANKKETENIITLTFHLKMYTYTHTLAHLAKQIIPSTAPGKWIMLAELQKKQCPRGVAHQTGEGMFQADLFFAILSASLVLIFVYK